MRTTDIYVGFFHAFAEGLRPIADPIEILGRALTGNVSDPTTGLTALHLAVGRGAIGIARLLIKRGALFVPDKLGRMPSSIAMECEVSEELCDYVVEAEAVSHAD